MRQPDSVEIKMCDGIFVKSMMIHAKGTVVPQHSHTYDHLSMLARGAVRIWKDGVLWGDFEAPTGIRIDAHTKHKFLSLEDDTLIYCIHNIRDAEQVDIFEENQLENA